jgi:pimeloyl-ACP methyl ester carboxylesterase
MNPETFSEETRALYAAAYDKPDAIRAGNGWYQTFQQDIADLKDYPVLTTPVLTLGGLYYPLTVAQMEGKATDIRFVEPKEAGHYLAEERPFASFT